MLIFLFLFSVVTISTCGLHREAMSSSVKWRILVSSATQWSENIINIIYRLQDVESEYRKHKLGFNVGLFFNKLWELMERVYDSQFLF